ncbi:hypothetical protein ACFSHR_07600 [Azotobacter chroococcum]
MPLLGLTLARLYRELGSDGDLSLDEYERMGGMAEVIKDEAESVLSPDPATRQTQLEQLHDAFIPALVTINPDSEQPMRRVAKLPDLPADSRPLVQALVDKHLLLSDLRGGQPVIEVAHESLFRQWDVLVDWLREERTDLLEVDRLEQAVSAWINNDRKAPWLMGGERLDRAEALAAKQRYSRRLEGSREFCWRHANGRKQREEEDQLRNEKLDAETAARREAEKRQQEAQLAARKLWAAVVGVAFLFIITVVFLAAPFTTGKRHRLH